MGGNTSVALFWVVVVIAFSFLVILFINMYTAHSQKYRERGLSHAGRKQAKDLAGQGDRSTRRAACPANRSRGAGRAYAR